MKLSLSKDLLLPVDVVTQTIALLAKRRAGKSYTMRRLVEQLFAAKQQVVLVDPKGDQWGLRFAADGKGPGLPFLILGGEHGDVPLEKGAGEVVAKLVVEERVSAVLDLSQFRKSELAHFMTDFLETLYRLKAREAFRTAMMLVIDEADAVAPQKPQKGEERMLGAAEDIVRRGGQRGIGCVFVTQRSAVLNKNVLTQAQILIALRTIAPQDLDAMKAWVEVHGTLEQQKTLMASLPSLPVGDAWVWSPGWPTADGIFQRVHVLPIETFDSGKSPEPGEKRVEPKRAADVDLEGLKRQMAATLERAKADDPRELRKRITELERQVKQGGRVSAQGSSTSPPTPKIIEKHVITDAQLARAEALLGQVDAAIARAAELVAKPLDKLKAQIGELAQAVKAVRQPALPLSTSDARAFHARERTTQPPRGGIHAVRSQKREVRSEKLEGGSEHHQPVTGPQQRILNALAWGEAMRLPILRREKVAFLADASPKSSAFMNNLGALRSAGFIDYPQQGLVALTNSGRPAAYVDADTAPETSAELQATICKKLPEPQARIVRALVRSYPNALTRQEVAEAAQASVSSSAFMNNLGALRSLGLIDYPRQGYVLAQPVLFLEEAS